MLDSRFENISNLSPILFLPKIILQFFQKDFPKIPKIKNTLETLFSSCTKLKNYAIIVICEKKEER